MPPPDKDSPPGQDASSCRDAPSGQAAHPESRRVLAIGAHPDDVEFGCGGILIKEAGRGHAVTVLNLTRGESGTHGSAQERQREAQAAAERMGTALEFLDLGGDARIEDHPRNALEIARAIRRLRPHFLLAPSPEENQHPDHHKAGRLTRDAARLARYGGLKDLEALPPHAIDALFFYDITGTSAGTALAHLARIIVDVSDVFETWRAAMECHASQMKTRDYVELQVAKARVLGAEIGAAYAMAVRANDALRLEALSDLRGSGRRF
jgi:bacillithiol biosynthesis deacetylase BshB1